MKVKGCCLLNNLQPVLVTPVAQELPGLFNGQVTNDFLLVLYTLGRCQPGPFQCGATFLNAVTNACAFLISSSVANDQ